MPQDPDPTLAPRPAPDCGQEPSRLERAAEVLRIEMRAIAALQDHLGAAFEEAVARVLACEGMVVVTGMGKAGLVGAKLSATLASTGTPSLPLHPAEALHGDLGRIRAQDLVIALSNSGESDEIKALLPAVRRIGATVIAITGRPESALGRHADCVLDIGRATEACPLGLAPTASTTAMLALGDALAVVVQAERGFSKEDYARYHPAGSLGRRLMRVEEVMRSGEELPLVAPDTIVREVIVTMTRTPGRPGAALVVDAERRLLGIFTDGDLRRLLEGGATALLDQPVEQHMGREPKRVGPEALLEEGVRLLREHKKDQLPVVDAHDRAVGLLDVQDVLDVRVS